MRRFNFGRCSPGGGTHRFKQQWGGRDVPLHWYQHARDGARQLGLETLGFRGTVEDLKRLRFPAILHYDRLQGHNHFVVLLDWDAEKYRQALSLART